MTPYIMTFYRIGYDKAIEAKKKGDFFQRGKHFIPKK